METLSPARRVNIQLNCMNIEERGDHSYYLAYGTGRDLSLHYDRPIVYDRHLLIVL